MTYQYYIETLGCSKNFVDSEIMMGRLTKAAYRQVFDPASADIIIVNTCGFIESAKEESLDTIFELLDYKERGNCRYFIVAGCLSQRYAAELAAEIPQIDAFVGTTTFDDIVDVVKKLQVAKGDATLYIDNCDRVTLDDGVRRIAKGAVTGYLKISEGCDNRCTYCIIPKLRGRYRSRTIESIVAEAKQMVAAGISELIVIAQDTSRYGIDIYGTYKLLDLLRELNALNGVRWIRLQYMYPDILDETVISGIAELAKVVNYFDIPVQHGSNAVLKRMNRNTSVEHIESVIQAIRKHCPDGTVRTTMIVGFPGETEADFEAMIGFVKRVRFDRLGAFVYSREEDTPAYNMPNQVAGDVAAARYAELMTVQQAISESLQALKLDTHCAVLIEEVVEENNIYVARTAYDAPEIDGVCYVHSHGKQLASGDFVTVKITDTLEFDIIGDYVEHC